MNVMKSYTPDFFILFFLFKKDLLFTCFLCLLQVDHAAAIKEYSRSSADQEEPLPHELRPSEVLSMTMDYLVTNIMDQGEGNYREWYDFVWNRTRGIRKVSTSRWRC